MSIVLSLSFICGFLILHKRYFSYRTNLKKVQNIHIALEDPNQKNDNNAMNCRNFNIQSYNSPLLNCFETNFLFALAFSAALLTILPLFLKIDKTDTHVFYFFVEVIMEYIVGMILPLYVLVKKESIRNYFWNDIPSFFS